MNDAVDSHWLSEARAAQLIAARKLSALELADALLAQVAQREPQVSAFVYLDPDQVRAAARACDATRAAGPLHGVPIGIKDVIATRDQPTQYNSPIYAGHRPDHDAVCVERLRAAGAIIMGKTVTTEFAYMRPGPTRNPHDLSRTPGGSSSGSAAAVADGMVPAALGTQTGGSMIRPAAFCGVYGYKPAFGQWPLRGTKHLAPSLDTLGLMTRDLDDIPLLSAVLSGEPAPRESPAPSLVLLMPSRVSRAEPAAVALLEDIGRGCARRLDEPPAMEALHDAHATIMAAEIGRAMASEWGEHRDLLSPPLAATVERGQAIAGEALAEAWSAVARARRWLSREVAANEIVLTLPAAGEAPEGLQSTGDATFNRLWTLLHASCLQIPAGRGPHGLPLGVQLVDVRGDEAMLLAGGRSLVRARGLAPPRPHAV